MGSDRQVGEKLLPHIIDGVVKGVIAAKTGLADHEIKVRSMSHKKTADTIGEELAELMQPLLNPLLRDRKLPDPIHEIVSKIASGDQQYQAIAGMAFGASGVTNVISAVMGNYLAGTTRGLLRVDPMLYPPVGDISGMVANGVLNDSQYVEMVNQSGYATPFADGYLALAQAWPEVDTLFQMVRRGVFSWGEGKTLFKRLRIPDDVVSLYEQILHNILTPADAALAVLRTDLTLEQGRKIAADNGITDTDFDTLMSNTGEPPGAQELMEAYRRQFINKDEFTLGIRQSRVRNEWIDTLLKLRYSPISTSDAVNSYVEGYITEKDVETAADQNGLEPGVYKTLIQAAGDPLSYTDMMNLWRYGRATEDDVKAALKRGRLKDDYIDFALALKNRPMSTADAVESEIQGYLTTDQGKNIAAQNGLSAADYETLRLTAGDPASRTEMIALWRRNEVTEADVKSALRQSRLKDSYIDSVIKLKTQLPALYMVNDLLSTGGLSPEEGTTILLESGYEASIVKRIVAYATGKKTAKAKTLTEGMYADLYKERAITAAEFDADIKPLGYSPAEAELLRELYDQQYAISARNGVISKVRANYTGHKIAVADAEHELNQAGVTAEMITTLITDWNIELESQVTLLSAAQVADAWHMNLFSGNPVDNVQAALDYLVGRHGYSDSDAVMVLELKNKGPLGGGSDSAKVPARSSNPQTSTTGS